jgi:biotin-[acetyl-CoA-carboxylase] ligase BirA-like protein
MMLITDDIAFAQTCGQGAGDWRRQDISTLPAEAAALAQQLFESRTVMVGRGAPAEHWNFLFAVGQARQSQYDVLARLAVSGTPPPHRTLCCAATGSDFHGFKNRSWQALRGNIHLSAFTRPATALSGDAAGLMVAAVDAALQTVQSFALQGSQASVKWVNDILIGDRKVGGVLTRLQKQGAVTDSAVIGIGLNVSQTPRVIRDACVPGVAAIAEFVADPQDCTHEVAFARLVEHLGKNLESLYRGGFEKLLGRYRQHSIALGREVTVLKDSRKSATTVLARGRVQAIGDALELYLQDRAEPLRDGRMILE